MGNVYTSLGLYQRGEALGTQAVDRRTRVLGPKDPSLRSEGSLAWILQREGRYAEAEKLGHEVQPRVLGQKIRRRCSR
jgi:hypothetical protein